MFASQLILLCFDRVYLISSSSFLSKAWNANKSCISSPVRVDEVKMVADLVLFLEVVDVDAGRIVLGRLLAVIVVCNWLRPNVVRPCTYCEMAERGRRNLGGTSSGLQPNMSRHTKKPNDRFPMYYLRCWVIQKRSVGTSKLVHVVVTTGMRELVVRLNLQSVCVQQLIPFSPWVDHLWDQGLARVHNVAHQLVRRYHVACLDLHNHFGSSSIFLSERHCHRYYNSTNTSCVQLWRLFQQISCRRYWRARYETV